MKYGLQKLDWDTSFFEIDSFKVELNDQMEEEDFKKLISNLNQNSPCFVQLSTSRIEFLEKVDLSLSPFRFMEENIFFEKEVCEQEEAILLEKATEEDIPELSNLVKDSFIASRFYKDKNIQNNLSNRLYEEWIRNSVLGLFDDYCLISKSQNEIVSFSSIKKTAQDEFKIGLLGVNKKFQGTGQSYKLIGGIENFLKKGLLKVSTQKENLPANKVYLNSNFNKVGAISFYHGWF